MSQQVLFLPLRLSDASYLRDQKLLPGSDGNLTTIRQSIRQILAECNQQVWIFRSEVDENQSGLLGIKMISRTARRGELCLYASKSAISPATIRQICDYVFRFCGLYRLEVFLPAEDESFLTSLGHAGFLTEGILRCAGINQLTERHHDIILAARLRPEHLGSQVAFILFKLGLFAVTGHDQGLQSAEFTRHGGRFSSELVQECAELAGFIGSDGRLAGRLQLQKLFIKSGSHVRPDAPGPVLEAARQIEAYFAGSREVFDLPLDLSAGSAFQVKVWTVLSSIPFGTTWTYEELAQQLTGDDRLAARNLARAVGSACGANPLPLILPCHRVIGKDGRLVGFSGGLDIKEYLLDHELMGLT